MFLFAEYEMMEMSDVNKSSTSNNNNDNDCEVNAASSVIGNGTSAAHSRNGSLKDASNGGSGGVKCRCMASSNENSQPPPTATVANVSDGNVPPPLQQIVKKENKSTQTALSTVNGISGGLFLSRTIEVTAGNTANRNEVENQAL